MRQKELIDKTEAVENEPIELKWDASTNTLTQESADEKVEITADKMISSFLGVLIAALLAGFLIGGVCIFACLKCYRRNQTKRLTETNNGFEFKSQTPVEPAKPKTETPDTEQIDNINTSTENDDFGQVLTSRGLVSQPPKEFKQTSKQQM